MELRTYKYRLYPSKVQEHRLFSAFDICCKLHNQLLTESNLVYKAYGLSWASIFTLNNRLKEIKDLESIYYNIHSQVLQNVCDRLGKAYSNFFRRIKEGIEKPGFPRFKSKVHSITYSQSGFEFTRDNRLQVSDIGNIPIVKHRELKGKIRTLTIKRNKVGQWHAFITCKVKFKKTKHKGKKIGIDVGLENYATLSDGKVISNPRFFIRSEKRLTKLQRNLSRKQNGSKNRRKAKYKLAKQHLLIANQRQDFLHKLSHSLTRKYKTISIEKLDIKNMVHNNHMSKNIHDASWAKFASMLSYKAVTCGGRVKEVDPRNTSRICSKCGTMLNMPLKKREFRCSKCGLVCHRDLNAAVNIKGRAGLARTNKPVNKRSLHLTTQSDASRLNEAGTIR